MDVGENDIKKLALESENTSRESEIRTINSSNVMEIEESLEREVIQENGCQGETKSSVAMETEDESVFKVTIGPQSSESTENSGDKVVLQEKVNVFIPPPRMNALMTVKNNHLFLYGGIYEVGDKQYTLSDMYSLDVSKMDEWSTIIECDLKSQVLHCFLAHLDCL